MINFVILKAAKTKHNLGDLEILQAKPPNFESFLKSKGQKQRMFKHFWFKNKLVGYMIYI